MSAARFSPIRGVLLGTYRLRNLPAPARPAPTPRGWDTPDAPAPSGARAISACGPLPHRGLELGRDDLGDLLRGGRLAPGRGSGSAAWRSSGAGGRGRGARGMGRALHTVAFPATVGGAMSEEPPRAPSPSWSGSSRSCTTAAALVPQLEAGARTPSRSAPRPNGCCACGSSGAAACGAGGVMAWGRGRGEGREGAEGVDVDYAR